MCANCKTAAGCQCDGGVEFDSCQSEQGLYCPACDHEADTGTGADAALLSAVVGSELVVEFE